MPIVELRRVAEVERSTLANLFELYLYDFSTIDPMVLGTDGRYSTPDMLAPYWNDPTRHEFFIVADGELAGFVLTKRGSGMASNTTSMDVAEFFVLRVHRRNGVGRAAAELLWRMWPEQWMVRVMVANREAVPFWESVIAGFTDGHYNREFHLQSNRNPPHEWLIFRFDASGAGSTSAAA